MIGVSVNAWTDVVGILVLAIAVVSVATIDRAFLASRSVGRRLSTIAAVATAALVALVAVRFVTLA